MHLGITRLVYKCRSCGQEVSIAVQDTPEHAANSVMTGKGHNFVQQIHLCPKGDSNDAPKIVVGVIDFIRAEEIEARSIESIQTRQGEFVDPGLQGTMAPSGSPGGGLALSFEVAQEKTKHLRNDGSNIPASPPEVELSSDAALDDVGEKLGSDGLKELNKEQK